MSFKTIANIYTGKQEKVLVDPTAHDGFVTKQQRDALQLNASLGPGVRLTLEGNIGSGKQHVPCVSPLYYKNFSLQGRRPSGGG